MNDDEGPLPISRRALIQTSVVALAASGMALSGPAGLDPAAAGGAGGAAPATSRTSVAGYIAERLSQHGCKVLFGVPGATCDPFFGAFAERADLKIVLTASDLEAGYAADGYARVRGLGAVSVTYGVGMLSMINAIAGSYVERSPVVVINGGPSKIDLDTLALDGTLFSHSIGRVALEGGSNDALGDLGVFKRVTAYAKRAATAAEVPKIVDDAIETALQKRRPVYVEIAKDLWGVRIDRPSSQLLRTELAASGKEAEVAKTILAKLKAASRPAVLVGIEVQRYRLADPMLAFLTKLQIPWATTLLAKSVLGEQSPGFAGVYDGAKSAPRVKRIIENSDALLAFGCVLGRQYRDLVAKMNGDASRPNRLMTVADGSFRIARSAATAVSPKPLLAALQAQASNKSVVGLAIEKTAASRIEKDSGRHVLFNAGPVQDPETTAANVGMTYDELMRAVGQALDQSFVLMTDTSLSMYPAADLVVHGRESFLCSAVWQSIGYSPAAAIGVGVAELPATPADTVGRGRRVLVVCGDGGFQMTAQSLSTMARSGLSSIVIVIDNGLYAIEQYVIESIRGITPSDERSYFSNPNVAAEPYLALQQWNYPELAKAMGFTFARRVLNEAELSAALSEAKSATGPSFIAAAVKRRDVPSELKT